jgi:hypothetical protein
MLTIRKSAITLGVLGAMIATTATPSLARSKHVRAPATEYGQQARTTATAVVPLPSPFGNTYTGWAAATTARAPRPPDPDWDDYAKRWDGGN